MTTRCTLCGPDPPTSQSDGRTDDMQSQYRALHYSASRGKKCTHCETTNMGLAYCIMRPFTPLSGTHCTYPPWDGQAEFTWVTHRDS